MPSLKPLQESDLSGGQHPPTVTTPFAKFPQYVDGPIVWKPEEYKNNDAKWVQRWTAQQIQDLEAAGEHFTQSGLPLTQMSRAAFPVSDSLRQLFASTREDLLNGKGKLALIAEVTVS